MTSNLSSPSCWGKGGRACRTTLSASSGSTPCSRTWPRFQSIQRKSMGRSQRQPPHETDGQASTRFARRVSTRSFDLADAFMVEPDRDAARRDEHGNAVADYNRSRMIDLKPVSTGQLHREYLEWFSLS